MAMNTGCGQDDAVHELGREHDSHELTFGMSDHDDDDEREDALEHGRFARHERHACFPAGCFADDERLAVRGRTQAARKGGCDQAEAKSASAYCPANRASARAAASAPVDLDALRVEHSSRGHDDEPCDEAGGDGLRYGVIFCSKRARWSFPFDDVALKNIIHGASSYRSSR